MTDGSAYELQRRGGPLIVAIPHASSHVPAAILETFTPGARRLPDTAWRLERLYAFADEIDATVIRAAASHYVIDLDRPVEEESRHVGTIPDSACPVESLSGEPIYAQGQVPDDREIARRAERFWRPYHAALREELARLRRTHPQVLLWNAHAVSGAGNLRFAGSLPDLSFGTNDGQSCGTSIVAAAIGAVRGSGLSWVMNGWTKGGFAVQRYGAPAEGVHALQLAIDKALYLDEAAPEPWHAERAARAGVPLRQCMESAMRALTRSAGAMPEDPPIYSAATANGSE